MHRPSNHNRLEHTRCLPRTFRPGHNHVADSQPGADLRTPEPRRCFRNNNSGRLQGTNPSRTRRRRTCCRLRTQRHSCTGSAARIRKASSRCACRSSIPTNRRCRKAVRSCRTARTRLRRTTRHLRCSRSRFHILSPRRKHLCPRHPCLHHPYLHLCLCRLCPRHLCPRRLCLHHPCLRRPCRCRRYPPYLRRDLHRQCRRHRRNPRTPGALRDPSPKPISYFDCSGIGALSHHVHQTAGREWEWEREWKRWFATLAILRAPKSL